MEKSGPVRTFSYHYRKKYGHGVGKVPLDVGVVCPNRARGGCIFCRPSSFTPSYLDSKDDLKSQLASGKKSLLKGRFKKYLAYFQQETCTVLPREKLLDHFAIPLVDPDCIGLIVSTRPDCVDKTLLVVLAELVLQHDKECLIELGIQSVHENSLALLNRNHGFADFVSTANLVKSFDCFELGAHLILGIPGETVGDMIRSLETVCSFQVDALKLHHLQVIKGTPLEKRYLRREVAVFSLEDYLVLLTQLLPRIPARVTLHRLWATSHPDLLVAPRWNVLASDLSRRLVAMMKDEGVWQGKYAPY
ncbi:hypothetical protein SAMN05660330_03300 [Desulforhopalus singaporensis]|uniref:Radical SAM core domain-containing protein n=1 Tax=Desulforhopalus singaporensis TaxID=91360 RepID=A0A1H0TZN6_9BACT|nr:hypothetical protein SAMN05660330_03300 [Desulforhopalus singaporensis]